MKDTFVSTRALIYDYIRKNSLGGILPSLRNICAGVGLASVSTAAYHIGKLEKDGMVSRVGKRKYSLVAINDPDYVISIPVYSGTPVGENYFHRSKVLYTVPFARSELLGNDFFAFEMKGSYLSEYSISDGDILVFVKNSEIKPKTIAAFPLNNRLTAAVFDFVANSFTVKAGDLSFECTDFSSFGFLVAVLRYIRKI